MHVSFCPQRCDCALSVAKSGDTLIINGDPVDLSVIPDGATLPADAVSNDFVVGNVERISGELHVTLLLPHGPNPSQAVAFPAPLADVPDGPLQIPRDPEPEPEPEPALTDVTEPEE
ncbi:hypothetical protein C5748_18515 [Phyllobacterium phragmitis]|uniref:Uncharacterized protein n=1 Tax=Phyllobacterium phragmitis TaxID=2670329 RepID=A0A2S9INS1_9HYPH|nr:hypothetical protein [Phyllobacterium phragmitis]PRD42142.1 hypothetical protein C5748_18515 [Phyllobacterium phragmitis]